MADDFRKRLDDLVRRRDAVKATKDRLIGRLESAKADLATIEKECRSRGVPPDKLEATIAELNRRLETATNDLSERIRDAEDKLRPFQEGAR